MTEITTAERNIRLNESADGKYCAIPWIFSNDWCVCRYIPASAGPIAAPMILIRVLIPRDIPLNCLGVDKIITFIAPTLVKDSPVDSIARLVETNNSVEWNTSKPIKAAAVMQVPSIIGFKEPNFDTINPEVGPNINSTTAKGNCTFPVLIASSPNPTGPGFLTRMGIVWKTINIDSPTSIMIKFAGRIALLSINLKSTSGYLERLSTITNSANEVIPPMIRKGSNVVEELELLLLAMLVAIVLPPVVSMNVNTSRNKVIVAARVIAPFTSI